MWFDSWIQFLKWAAAGEPSSSGRMGRPHRTARALFVEALEDRALPSGLGNNAGLDSLAAAPLPVAPAEPAAVVAPSATTSASSGPAANSSPAPVETASGNPTAASS